MADLLNELRQSLQADSAAAEIEMRVEVDLDADVEATIFVDRGALHRALLNVGQNAIQASSAGHMVVLRVHGDDAGFVFSVQDQGQGIAPDKLQDILTPFFTTKEKGTGLGLALVDKIVRAHCGQLLINSEPGQGTTMSLRIPRDFGSCGQALNKSDDMHDEQEQ